MKEAILLTDGYKLAHHKMYPEGIQLVYSNLTPRSNRYFPEAKEGSVVFGIQYLIKEYLIKQFNEGFFKRPKGIQTLSENYDRVIITNSYKNWENIPNNVTVYSVI